MLQLHYARRGRRRSVDILCELVQRDADCPMFHRMIDLSPYGVWLETSAPLAVGSHVALAFQLPGGEEMIVFAEVTRVRESRGEVDNRGMGLEFIDLSSEERRQLIGALRSVPDDGVRLKSFARSLN
jgi:hypothetical protein